MIFFIFNIAFFAVLLGISFTIKTNSTNELSASRLVNLVLFLASIFAMMSLTMGLNFWASSQFALVIAKVTFVLIGWFSVSCCDYILLFPDYKKPTFMYIVQWALNIFAAVMIFQNEGMLSFDMVDGSFSISSGSYFIDANGGSWYSKKFVVSALFYYAVIPFFSVLMVLVRAENEKNNLIRQKMLKNVAGVVSSWCITAYMFFGSRYQPMLFSLLLVSFIPEILLFINASASDEIIDKHGIIRNSIRFFIKYVLPGISCAYVYSILWPKFYDQVLFFEVIYISLAVASAIMIFSIRKFSTRSDILREKRYATYLTEEIKSIKLDGASPLEINTTLFKTLKKYTGAFSMNVMGDIGDGTLKTVYSTNDKDVSCPVDDVHFEMLLTTKRHVFLRQYIEHEYSISDVREGILHFMDENDSDAFILLNEGRHIIGIIFLGRKQSGNHYNDYDYESLNNLYSDFFVIGYYQKNIANEDVVGTVNREIQMSGQIITSIQENMDFISNPKIDVGYLMVPAHNIGGEFVDFIRLNNLHHIFIIGSLSGKGIAASMNMVILKSVIRTFLVDTSDFKQLVQKINYFICTSLPKGTYFAGTIGLIDFVTNTMYYVNCGSSGVFYYTRSFNNVIEVQGQGHILGFKKDISDLIKVRDIHLSEGDIVLSCTDGLLESKSLRGEVYGKDRVQKQIIENVPYDSSKTAKFIYDNLVSFTSKQLEDDVTMVVFKYHGGEQK